MINSIQVNEANVREVKNINGVLILSLLSTQSNGRNNYFQAKCYGQSSSLNVTAGTRLSLDGKITFDTNGKAYVAINFPSQMKLTATQPSQQNSLERSEVVKSSFVQPINQQKVRSTVVVKSEIYVEDSKMKFFDAKKEITNLSERKCLTTLQKNAQERFATRNFRKIKRSISLKMVTAQNVYSK
jgi:hypothetical protein